MGNFLYNIFFSPYQSLVNQRKLTCMQSTSLNSKETENNNVVKELDDKIKKVWDLNGLKQETSRAYLRTFKKIEKANERLNKSLMSTDTESVTSTSVVDLKNEIAALKARLLDLTVLEEDLKKIKSTSNNDFQSIIERALALELSDSPPVRADQQVKVKKPKAATQPRKPYFRFTSIDNILIKVGRSAADNDELSLSSEHREGSHWWLHVAGCPGSHVVICNSDDNLPTSYRETLIDAALLAAVNSKTSQSGRVQVTYTRCRHVTKPYGAKPGLVFLKDEVATTRIDVKAENKRLERLLLTKDKEP